VKRLFFREAWVLLLAMVMFGAAAAGLFWWSFPSGGGAWVRLGVGVALLVLVGGFVAPIVTRALKRRG
jgi:hypothetical protein